MTFQNIFTVWPESFAKSTLEVVLLIHMPLENIILHFGAPIISLDITQKFISDLINELYRMVSKKM